MVWRLFGLAFLIAFPFAASAQVVISEVMYDLAEGSDSGREWIEVYNEGSVSVNLTEWKFVEGNTKHGITAIGSSDLSPGSYAVIAADPSKFKIDWPQFSGLLFDSAFSLNNTGETLKLACCGKEPSDKDSIAYSGELGGAGDGASLSRSGASLISTDPTPGAAPGAARVAPPPAPPPQSPPPAQKLPEPPPPPTKEKQQEVEASPVNSSSTQMQPSSETLSEVASVIEKPQPLPSPPKQKKEPKQEPVEVVTASEKSDAPAATAEISATTSSHVAAAAGSGFFGGSNAWWMGAVFLAFGGGAAAYLAQKKRKNEWEIVEQTD